MIDLRSDTVTQPTAAMRQAMMQAPVGDAVLGDDPTVQALEAAVAALLGKEAAVYAFGHNDEPSGAAAAYSAWGRSVFRGRVPYLLLRGWGPAALSGVSCRLLPGEGGVFSAQMIQQVLRPADPHFPRPTLVCVENTHNRGGGRIFPLETIEPIAQLCRQQDWRLHMDGARFWNACVATGLDEATYAQPFDTVSVCFSKGLGAPVGSALVGTAAQMAEARRFTKMFGGGMRQAGVIAAGALYALQHHRDRLAEDHTHAQRLALGLQGLKGVAIAPERVQTNIVNIGIPNCPAADVVKGLAQRGVAVLTNGPHQMRAVTNLMVNAAQIEQAVEAIAQEVAAAL